MSNQVNLSKQNKGLYLLPNLLTTASLFAAFYAIIAAIDGRIESACIAVLIAMILDSLDGRVARLTGSQSEFGAQYDSLSDVIAFGITPAIIAYTWSLSTLGKLGWLSAFIYVSAVALRLARFNTQLNQEEKQFFQGLPCPVAAGFIVSAIWTAHSLEFASINMRYLLAGLSIIIALLMVSNIRYHSFKEVSFTKRLPIVFGLLIVLLFVAIAINPPVLLFLLGLTYSVSGPIFTITTIYKAKKGRKNNDNNVIKS